MGEGLGLGVGLGLGNQIAISRRGVIIWQGVENGHTTVPGNTLDTLCSTHHPNTPTKPASKKGKMETLEDVVAMLCKQ